MPLSFQNLMSFLSQAEVRFLIAPDMPLLAIPTMTTSGRTFLLHGTLEADGSLMQLRTNGYLTCPVGSPHREAVLRVLNDLNFRLRIVKFTMDADDGEVVVYADLAIMDSEPTLTQVMALIGFCMERVREVSERIEETIKTGIDPLDEDVIV